jgi:hypothetical protein
MKARLYLDYPGVFDRGYRVVVRGQTVGTVDRYRDKKHGKWPWTARAWLADGPLVFMSGFRRRCDAKRWVIENQTVVT